MKIPKDAAIAPNKLTPLPFLAACGFTPNAPDILMDALRRLVSKNDARVDAVTAEGILYRVPGLLTGPKGAARPVVTFWLKKRDGGAFAFVRLEPDSEGH